MGKIMGPEWEGALAPYELLLRMFSAGRISGQELETIFSPFTSMTPSSGLRRYSTSWTTSSLIWMSTALMQSCVARSPESMKRSSRPEQTRH